MEGLRIHPEREEFDALRREWPLVPAWTELSSDVSTPVGVFPSVTKDGPGVLLESVERSEEDVAAAFAAEARHYRPRSHLGRDDASLALPRRECVEVFLREARAELAPETFVDAFIGALVFEPVPGAAETVEDLRARGLELAVVANWDRSLHEHLERLELDRLFDAVVTSAEAGAAKPDPAIFRAALERLDVEPARALHVGDEEIDEQGARAAGMRFAPAPLESAFEGWT